MDQLRRPQRGDPLKIPAFVYAEMLDTVEFVRGLRRSDSASLVRLARDRGLVKVKNESGSDVARFGILGIDGIISAINPTDDLAAWKNEPVLSGNTPDTDDHYGKFVVLVEPLADDAIGWGLASGVVPVQISFTYSDSPYADITNSDATKLTADEGGAAQVLYKETGTGTKWTLCRIGTPHRPVIRGKLDADLNSGSSATMSVWAGATLADTGRNVTVYDASSLPAITASKKIASGKGLSASWHDGKWHLLTPYACEVDQ